MSKWRVSQSLLKHFGEYRSGLTCGLAFEAEYITKDPDFHINKSSSEEMKAGAWFEYKAFGGLPVYGPLHKPGIVSKGERKGEVTAAYKYAEEQADVLRETLMNYGFENIRPGVTIETEELGGVPVVSHLDLLVDDNAKTRNLYGREEPNPFYGQEAIIDLKFSGLLNDKWNKMGWDEYGLPDRHYIMIQAIHYVWHYFKKFGKVVPFYFYVASSKNGYDKKFFLVNIDHETLFPRHENQIQEAVSEIELAEISGFTPRPSPTACFDCPIGFKCKHRTRVPSITVVDYTG